MCCYVLSYSNEIVFAIITCMYEKSYHIWCELFKMYIKWPTQLPPAAVVNAAGGN